MKFAEWRPEVERQRLQEDQQLVERYTQSKDTKLLRQGVSRGLTLCYEHVAGALRFTSPGNAEQVREREQVCDTTRAVVERAVQERDEEALCYYGITMSAMHPPAEVVEVFRNLGMSPSDAWEISKASQPYALYELANAHLFGVLGACSDASLAARYFVEAHNAGVGLASWCIGYFYEEGGQEGRLEWPRDLSRAAEFYEMAEARGYHSSHNMYCSHAVRQRGDCTPYGHWRPRLHHLVEHSIQERMWQFLLVARRRRDIFHPHVTLNVLGFICTLPAS